MNTKTNEYIYIHLEYRDDATLVFNKYNDNDLIHLDIKIHPEHHRSDYMPKMIYLK
ncbi:conserved hypothetical protein (plasmid) [Borreliella garinii Far04]|nr:conserved hypothetical protein [Borreliella garinii Far04]